jgi:hypothetical protein
MQRFEVGNLWCFPVTMYERISPLVPLVPRGLSPRLTAGDDQMGIFEYGTSVGVCAAYHEADEIAVLQVERWVKHFFLTDGDFWNEDAVQFFCFDTEENRFINGHWHVFEVANDALTVHFVVHLAGLRVNADADSCVAALRHSAQIRSTYEAEEELLLQVAKSKLDFKNNVTLDEVKLGVVKA